LAGRGWARRFVVLEGGALSPPISRLALTAQRPPPDAIPFMVGGEPSCPANLSSVGLAKEEGPATAEVSGEGWVRTGSFFSRSAMR